mmetsp:Transcript_23211/g.48979  ORF Transcript_23211/g.48979 Transcript_23211/m.48979 type:complete len:175 (+) Transcript_23211:286-810(+)
MSNTLLLDIHSLLNDEDIADIYLIPETTTSPTSSSTNNNEKNDGISSVPAVKAILAARSPVFRRMLYGEFRETKQSSHNDNNNNNNNNNHPRRKLDRERTEQGKLSNTEGAIIISQHVSNGSNETTASWRPNINGRRCYAWLARSQIISDSDDGNKLACLCLWHLGRARDDRWQ